MNWITNFLTSSIGRKLIMSLTGLFLISFLIVHLAGNLQLLKADGGEAFNIYAYFMTTNPLIKFLSYGLYFGILLHAIIGLLLWSKNRKAKGSKYAVRTYDNGSFASKNMALLGTIVLVFLFIHMGDFWWKMKFGEVPLTSYESIDYQVKDLYMKVSETFSKPLFIVLYILGMLGLGFHLWHGFSSAFQTLGINHKKYSPIIAGLGKIYAVVVSLAYAIIPIYFYLMK